ncbi:MAG TPA: tetratricopeptide repeat protein [Thermoanaerobaculia bacterium]|nr:tetratricopeptide repeat protein [Thermoanaerobaculia bacterium]
MTRDNVLYVLVGLLAGFIAGYFVHEAVVARQPPRAVGAVPFHGGTAPQGAPPGAAPATDQGAQMQQIEQLRQQVDANPEDAEAILALANLNYDIRSWARAQELYQRYLELRPPDPDVLTDLGVTLREQGDHRAALDRFTTAQELAAEHWQSLYNQVVVLAFDLQRYEEAEAVLERLRQLQPGNPDVERLAEEVERRSAAA